MKALRIHEHGGPDVLKWESIPDPTSNSDEVLVEIKSTSMNHLDIWVRNGMPNCPLPMIVGSDGAGVVSSVGDSVSQFTSGDEVIIQPLVWCGDCRFCKSGRENHCLSMGIFGESQNGTMAEFISVPQKNVKRKPANLNFDEAAALALVGQTAYAMLVRRANLQPGETVLVWGASSGVGSMAIQIAKHMGCSVIATAGSDAKADAAKDLGADHTVNYKNADVASTVKDFIDGNGADVVFEHVGKSSWKTSLKCLAKGGRLVTCGATTGPNVEVDLRHIFIKQQSILGSTMGDVAALDEVLSLAESGVIKSVIDSVFKMENAADAHRRLESGEAFGKIILNP